MKISKSFVRINQDFEFIDTPESETNNYKNKINENEIKNILMTIETEDKLLNQESIIFEWSDSSFQDEGGGWGTQTYENLEVKINPFCAEYYTVSLGASGHQFNKYSHYLSEDNLIQWLISQKIDQDEIDEIKELIEKQNTNQKIIFNWTDSISRVNYIEHISLIVKINPFYAVLIRKINYLDDNQTIENQEILNKKELYQWLNKIKI
jgi:heat shock protein HspQ